MQQRRRLNLRRRGRRQDPRRARRRRYSAATTPHLRRARRRLHRGNAATTRSSIMSATATTSCSAAAATTSRKSTARAISRPSISTRSICRRHVCRHEYPDGSARPIRAGNRDNFEVATKGVEDIYIDTGAGPDEVFIIGSLGGTGLATSTITIDGGSGTKPTLSMPARWTALTPSPSTAAAATTLSRSTAVASTPSTAAPAPIRIDFQRERRGVKADFSSGFPASSAASGGSRPSGAHGVADRVSRPAL